MRYTIKLDSTYIHCTNQGAWILCRFLLDILSSSLQLTFSEPLALGAATSSEFEVEPVQGRKVSKVVKTTVVRGERMEKQMGDPSLAADLPSAREDFEKVSGSNPEENLRNDSVNN